MAFKRALVGLTMAGLIAGCGYSEDEWQMQLAKYNKLSKKYESEKAERARVQSELEAAAKRVADLKKQLKDMGVNLDQLSQALQASGTEKEQLAANLEQLKRALEEYKARAAVLERIKARFEQLRQKLKKLTEMGLKVSIRNNRMVISLPGDVLFGSGQVTLKPEAGAVLKQVADVIRNDSQLKVRYFQVAGHTDDRPLKGGPYKDNWGLSAMRAREVLVWLTTPVEDKDPGGGLDTKRLHAAGYGETDPVADNGTEPGRQSNRRVELVLMPDVEEMMDLHSLTD